ncbi:MAG TPA: hypothetical protein VH092_38055 [Urbifossiella sp.]|nr:hypothetical protein [Urbifossiella sp.]
MTRWIGKRGLWGVLTGTAVAAGSVLSGAEPGETVVFKEGNKDRKVIVVKADKQKDGSVKVHGKDAATGEAVDWVEGATGDTPPPPPAGGKAAPTTPAAKTAPGTKDTGVSKTKARADDSTGSAATPMPETPTERDRRLFNGKLLGRDTPAAATPAPPQIAEAAEPKQKQGLLGRLFGKKTTPAPVPAAMPGPAITTPAASGEPKVTSPARVGTAIPTPAPVVRTTPVTVPTPAIPVPMAAPARPPVSPTPVPVPTPLPAIPLPTIPPAPAGLQSARPGQPLHVILPVGYVPVEVAMADDIRPYATDLKTALAPSQRLIGAKGLAEGRHGSTDQVKAILFAAAKSDPAATVRAGCIDHLVRLGFYHPDFLRLLHDLSEGPAGEERDAARVALTRMTPRTW